MEFISCIIFKYIANKLEQYPMFIRSIRMSVREIPNCLNFAARAMSIMYTRTHGYSRGVQQ